jgi:hypothetical protein
MDKEKEKKREIEERGVRKDERRSINKKGQYERNRSEEGEGKYKRKN